MYDGDFYYSEPLRDQKMRIYCEDKIRLISFDMIMSGVKSETLESDIYGIYRNIDENEFDIILSCIADEVEGQKIRTDFIVDSAVNKVELQEEIEIIFGYDKRY